MSEKSSVEPQAESERKALEKIDKPSFLVKHQTIISSIINTFGVLSAGIIAGTLAAVVPIFLEQRPDLIPKLSPRTLIATSIQKQHRSHRTQSSGNHQIPKIAE
jgi:hypothetical protein